MASARQTVPPLLQLAAHPLRWRLLTELSDGDFRVRELVARVGEPQNLVSYHLRLLREGGLVATTRSSHDGRDSYYHLDLDRAALLLSDAGAQLHPALHMAPTSLRFVSSVPPTVLFVCTGNSARSVIAEALLHLRAGAGIEVFSAGTQPKSAMHPDTVRMLRAEFDIDLSDRRPSHLDTLTERRFDAVITLCDKAREVCPDFGEDPRWIHWSIPDPAASNGSDEDTYPLFLATAAEIDTRIRYLLPTLSSLDPTKRSA
nr:ArsR family transcriptional regulator [Nocardia fluminea]